MSSPSSTVPHHPLNLRQCFYYSPILPSCTLHSNHPELLSILQTCHTSKPLNIQYWSPAWYVPLPLPYTENSYCFFMTMTQVKCNNLRISFLMSQSALVTLCYLTQYWLRIQPLRSQRLEFESQWCNLTRCATMVASLQDGPSGPYLLTFTSLFSPFPHCIRVGLCAQQKWYIIWDWVIKDTMASILGLSFSLSIGLLALGEAGCHVKQPCGETQVARKWGLPTTT